MEQNFSKFYKLTRSGRLDRLKQFGYLTSESYQILAENQVLSADVADNLVENQLGQYPLPLGLAINMVVNQQPVVVPIVTEEPSVIAACSNGAKLVAGAGGFETKTKQRLLTGQIVLQGVPDSAKAEQIILEHRSEIIAFANVIHPSIAARGGGLLNIRVQSLTDSTTNEDFLTVYLDVDVKEAMGANIINTILEGVTPYIEVLTDGTALLSILSNYNDQTIVTANCTIPVALLATSHISGRIVAERIAAATRYANLDIYRATTHNKGIMNGIDGVLLATGNDTRAIEAGVHAYASRSGHYQALTSWHINERDELVGELSLPMPVGIVGGAISVLPTAKVSLELLQIKSAQQLGEVIAAVGLAQNLSALKALVSEGIQTGHMSLQAKSLAIQVGAEQEEIDEVVAQLLEMPRLNSQSAREVLNRLRQKKS